MPPACRVCVDPRRDEIDREIASGRSIPKIALEFNLPESNMYRHRKDHVVTAIIPTAKVRAATTVGTLEALDAKLQEILGMCVVRGHTGSAVAAIGQGIKIALEIGNLRGEIAPKAATVTHVHVDKATAAKMAESYLAHTNFVEGKSDDR